ncbi:MAG TPA: hypothetical protein VJC04_02190 [Candidatus Paceibacterota bacterium]
MNLKTLKVFVFVGVVSLFTAEVAHAQGIVFGNGFKNVAEVVVSSYSRNEKISYTCDYGTSRKSFRGIVNYLALALGLQSPLAESPDPASCTGSGGNEELVTDLTWNSKGGQSIITTKTAPRYGSKTCSVNAKWSPESAWPPRRSPISIADFCEKKTYICEGGRQVDDDDCWVLWQYGPFRIQETGRGTATYSVTAAGINRRSSLNLNTKLLLRIYASDTNLKEIKLSAKATEIKGYYRNAITRQLGWSEYTVAGKYVGHSRNDAYIITLYGRKGDVIDVTPGASVPFYLFNVTPISIKDK